MCLTWYFNSGLAPRSAPRTPTFRRGPPAPGARPHVGDPGRCSQHLWEVARMSAFKSAAIPPSAARLTESLRDIGYDFPAAVAEVVDNSIMADASRVGLRSEERAAE